MPESDSIVAELIERLQYLQVTSNQPFCWLIKSRLAPWSAKHCEAERDRFLADLLASFGSALWCSDHLSERAGEVAWFPKKEAVPPIVSENSYVGDWVLLLFAQEVGERGEVKRSISGQLRSCDDAVKLLEVMGADLLIHSQPDDIEWLIALRH